jgi:two-component system, NtrC family, response regulator AtoC
MDSDRNPSNAREDTSPGEPPTELDALERQGEHGAAAPRAWLLVRHQSGTRVLDLIEGSEVLIGRSRDAAVFLDDTKASRRHARVWRHGNALYVQDLGSRNGTRVNDTVLHSQERRLGAGDVIRVGECEAVVAITTLESTLGVEETAPAVGKDRLAAGAHDAAAIFVVADVAMNRVFAVARRLALVDTTVLILGETGVGKEVLAREIHARSTRNRAPFVRVNCPSLPENLLESELFGYERGAFTGAVRNKIGFFEAAQGGTLLLDEIGDFPLHLQVKLLAVLENHCVLRLGGTREIPIDVRVVCATHRDLQAEVAAERFREDLFYRINPFTLRIPPLRERPAEVLLLAGLFARQCAQRMAIAVPVISPEAASALVAYRWPGNVRELRNSVEHAIVLQDSGVIGPEHLPETVRFASESPSAEPINPKVPMRDRVSDLERSVIEKALAAEGGNQTRAAQKLGISRRALIYKIQKYGLGR